MSEYMVKELQQAIKEVMLNNSIIKSQNRKLRKRVEQVQAGKYENEIIRLRYEKDA